MSDYIKIRLLAEKLATNAGHYLMSAQTSNNVVVQKDRQDICTTADLGAESIIIDGIKNTYPDHSIQSEEAGFDQITSDYKWIIDPLDGTKEYVRNIPQYNSSIAVEYKGQLVAAAIYRPTDDILYSASFGDGSFSNGKRIQVSTITNLDDSFIYCYLPAFARSPDRYEKAWKTLGIVGKKIYRLRSFADENTALCWLAQGGHEGYLNISNSPKWHDIAPGILIAQEAGAYIPPAMIQSLRENKATSLIVANNVTIWQEINNIITN